MEKRNAQHHKDRLVEAIKDELVVLVSGGLSDPRIGLVSVNEVRMAPGGKAARVYVSAEGSEQEQKKSLTALNEAVGFIRHSLAQSLSLRVAPDLVFVLENCEKNEARIDELLNRIEKQNKKIS